MALTSRILRVGFELEGGWAGEPRVSPFKDLTLIADPSINGQTLKTAPIKAVHVGEAVSPPMVYGAVEADSKVDWKEWLLSHWPNAEGKDRTNHTCGFHIHLSVLSLKDYSLLTSKLFLFQLRDRMAEVGKKVDLPSKHEFWNRVGGKNAFCTLLFDPAHQMKVKKDGEIHRCRYGWLNFSWRAHGTMEFRALPTFRDAPVGLRFAVEYFNFVDEWLEANKGVELVREAKF